MQHIFDGLPFLASFFSIVLGVVACFFGSLVGFGGGFISVPILRLSGHLTPQVVAATSLFMVGVNVAVASFALRKKKRINLRIGWSIGLGGIVGALAGVVGLKYVSSSQFDVLYGLMLLFIAFNMLKPAPKAEIPDTQIESDRSLRASNIEFALMGMLVGFSSSLFGIGAGTVAIPLLLWRYKLPAYVAMPTASFIATIYIWPGVLAQIHEARVDWALAIPLAIGAVIGAHFGARYSNKLKSPQLKRIFGVICVITFITLSIRHLPMLQPHPTTALAATMQISKAGSK
ncbi:MAG TPA: sulfite exporter TauE/SafE family protein [Candidatus Baltobacteraceae bacterium]|nr:sulfite exporter TauE/SafE family protein [Candidatus Baltobacteraceae bacterium]